MRQISGLVLEILPGERETGFKDKNGKNSCYVIIEEAQVVPLKSGSVIDKKVPVAVHFWDWRATPLIENSGSWLGQQVTADYENYSYKTSAKLIGKTIGMAGALPGHPSPARSQPQAAPSQPASGAAGDLPF